LRTFVPVSAWVQSELLGVVVGLDLLGLEAVGPRVHDDLARRLEVILDVALAAHERPHLLTGGIAIGVVVRDTLLRLERLDPRDEGRPRHPRRHRLRVVAVDARHRILDERPALIVLDVVSVAVRHTGYRLEALLDVTLADEAVEREVRRVTLQTRPRLLSLGDALRALLVEQRVGVATPVAVVEREGIAREDALEPGIALELLRCGIGVAARESPTAVLRAGGFRGPEVRVVLVRPVAAPDARIHRVLSDLDDPHEGLPRLLLALEDVGQECQEQDSEPGHRREGQHDEEPCPPHLARSPSPAGGAVTGLTVTMQTVELTTDRAAGHGVDEVRVAARAVVANDAPVARRDLDRLLEVLERERRGMTEAVIRLGDPLGGSRVGQMALHARRRVAMAALDPGVVLLVHDVAVHTCPRVAREVREPLGVDEREGADAERDAEHAGRDDQQRRAPHCR